MPTFSVGMAIMLAANRASPGDVILLEQQATWRVGSQPERFIPVEWFPCEFDAIQAATARGFVVIEAGGNGRTQGFSTDGQNLDDPAFIASRNGLQMGMDVFRSHPNPFDPANPSSGAVIVGAGAGRLGVTQLVDRSRIDYSTYGRRVDVQAWGENIASTGALVPSIPSYCNLNMTGKVIVNTNLCYTATFGGTSGASAIIAGITASVQGILKASARKPLTSQQFIQLYRDPTTGVAQANGDANHPATQRIGQRPDMSLLVTRALQLSSPAT
jgi:hypothetical protein